jgi:prepilin-type N-terminal cleavage/methylation domain-containing protein
MKAMLIREMKWEVQMRKDQRGMTLIELMIALTILVIGVGALMIMIASAMAQNNGTKHDSHATMLAQMVSEQIINIPGNVRNPASLNPPTPPPPIIRDCAIAPANPNHLIAVTAAAGPAGAGALVVPQPAPAGRVAGDIDFTQAFGAIPQEAGTNAVYAMQYVACGDAGRQPTYDVRWNIRSLSGNVKLITVAARRSDNTGRRGVGFNMPVTIRTIAGL